MGMCKKGLSMALLSAAAAATAIPVADPILALRDCVRDAASAGELTGCETQAASALRVRIKELEAAIFAELDTKERRLFEENIEAWERYLQAEAAMAEFAFGARRDGMGAQLELGESNKLLEQRFDQLRAYLTSLKQ